MVALMYREIADPLFYDLLVDWLVANDVPYQLRVVNNKTQLGMPVYFWRKAEYVGAA
jgi:hypothetical protein